MQSSTTPQPPFEFACAAVKRADGKRCAIEAAREVRGQLTGSADLAVAFFHTSLGDEAVEVANLLCDELQTENLLGCSGESIVANDEEIEQQPALAVWACRLPNTTILPMHLSFERTPDGGSFIGWPDDSIGDWPKETSLLLLGDPFSFPADVLFERLNDERPGTPVVGGMASGAWRPGDARLLMGRTVAMHGAVGCMLHGRLRLRTVVSQGCRPIGERFIITRAERNLIFELGGKPALTQLQRVFDALPNREKLMVQESLHLGRVVSEYQDRFEQGDFLVRNVMGTDMSQSAVVVGDFVRAGQTVQFHVRDGESADAEMRQMLTAIKDSGAAPSGGLLFSCNGRGTRLFGHPHHDAALTQECLGPLPLAGFFAAGEFGPIGGKNFVHGYTASIALFESRSEDP